MNHLRILFLLIELVVLVLTQKQGHRMEQLE
jgi:hypothetical protein